MGQSRFVVDIHWKILFKKSKGTKIVGIIILYTLTYNNGLARC